MTSPTAPLPPERGQYPQQGQGRYPPEGGQYPQQGQGRYPPQGGQYPQQGRYPPEGSQYPPQGQYPQQGPYPPQRRSTRPTVDAGQLWAGGVATAVVAGLIALVGVLVCRWVFNIPVLAPRRDGAYGDAHTTTVVLVAAGGAIVATIVIHLLLIAVPRPLVFFGWIVALVTVIFVIFPFRTGAPLKQEVATAAVYLVIGVAIGSLLVSVADRATRVRRAAPPPPPPGP
jgi:predicted DCC family thiol-disulfide oxidoreductase YuxK